MIIGLIGAGIVHIAVLLLLPRMSPRDAWSRLAEQADLYEVSPYVTDSDLAGAAGIADPFFQAVACRIDLSEGIAHVQGSGVVPYWSASVYDRSGQNIYSLNDRGAKSGQLDVVVLTPAQMVDLRKAPLEELQNAVFVETPISQGIVVVRGFAPDQTWVRSVAEFLGAIECAAETI
ncbi:MAG: DUF1254 domain-containing protein [Rhizobiaceae bacterium]